MHETSHVSKPIVTAPAMRLMTIQFRIEISDIRQMKLPKWQPVSHLKIAKFSRLRWPQILVLDQLPRSILTYPFFKKRNHVTRTSHAPERVQVNDRRY